MSNPDLVPIFDLRTFDQSSFSLTFLVANYNSDGTLVGPYDFTDKIVTVTVDEIFQDPLILTSEVSENALGSFISVTAPPTDGLLSLYFSSEDLQRATHSRGFWRIVVSATPDPIILMRGSFTVVALSNGGGLS